MTPKEVADRLEDDELVSLNLLHTAAGMLRAANFHYNKYNLPDIPVRSTKAFYPETPEEHARLRRSAHNYNARTDMYFSTRSKGGIVYITRIR